MEVRATQRGFYINLKEAGDTFDVSPDLFSARWMERVEPKEVPQVPQEKPVRKRGRPKKVNDDG